MRPRNRFLAIGPLLLTACALLFGPIWVMAPAQADVQQLTQNPDNVYDFKVSPDGQWVVFSCLHYGTYISTLSLYSVSINGGLPRRLAERVIQNSQYYPNVRDDFKISADSQRVLYFGRASAAALPSPTPGGSTDNFPGFGLYSVPINGATASTLLADDPHVHRFAFSPNGLSVFYATGPDAENGLSASGYRSDLFRVPVNGGAPARVNIDLPTDQSVAFDKWVVLDSGYVVYPVGMVDIANPLLGSMGSVDLYSVPVDGTANQSLKLTTCGTISLITGYRTTTDGQRIVFAGPDCDGQGVIRSVAPTGTNPVRLSPVGLAGWVTLVAVSADDRFIVYSTSQTVNQQSLRNLYSAPIQGPSSDIRLVQSGSAGGINPVLLALSPDGEWLAYISANANITDLYVAARTGTTNSGRWVSNDSHYDARPVFSRDSRFLLYGTGGLMSLDVTSSARPVSLGAQSSGIYHPLLIHPNTNRVVLTNSADTVFSVPVTGAPATPIQISHSPLALYTEPVITPNGLKIVYITHTFRQLYISDIDRPYTAPTPVYSLPQGCNVGPLPTATTGPTRTPFPTEYALFVPMLKQCYPFP